MDILYEGFSIYSCNCPVWYLVDNYPEVGWNWVEGLGMIDRLAMNRRHFKKNIWNRLRLGYQGWAIVVDWWGYLFITPFLTARCWAFENYNSYALIQ